MSVCSASARLLCVLSAGLFAACSGDAPTWLPYPPSDDARSMLLGFESEGTVEGHLVDLDGRPPVIRWPSPGESATVYALSFDTPRGDIPVEGTGALRFSPAAEDFPILLPRATTLHRTSVSGGAGQAWRTVDETSLPEVLRGRVRLVNDDPFRFCSKLEVVETVELPGTTGSVSTLLPLGPKRVFIGTDDNQSYLFEDGVLTPLENTDVRMYGAAIDADGQLWFASRTGRLWSAEIIDGRLEGTRVLRAALDGFSIAWLSVGRDFAFALSSTGRVRIWDRSTSEWGPVVYDFQEKVGPVESQRNGELLRLSEDEAMISFGAWPGVLRVVVTSTGANPSVEITEMSLEGAIAARGVTALVRVEPGPRAPLAPDLGVLLGSSTGEILQWNGADWTSFGESNVTAIVHKMLTYRNGFAFVGGSGNGNEYVHPDGFCERFQAGGGATKELVHYGDNGLLAGALRLFSASQTLVTLLGPNGEID